MLSRLLRTMVLAEMLGAAAIAGWLAADRGWEPAAALAAGIATPIAVHAGIIALNCAIAWLAGSPTPAAHRIGVRGALATYLREVVDSIRVFQWALPWQAGRALPGEHEGGEHEGGEHDRGATRPPARIPVVLVHGYLCNRQLWRPFARWLAARGHAVQGVDLEPVFGSIDGYAPQIEDAVRTLRARTGADRVAIVCHSMGGLAARAYLRAHPDAPVGCLVTLGTPHMGTAHARLGQGDNARQMRPDSAWLQALAASESDALRGRITIVLSHHDNIVAPQALQTLPGARVVEFSGLGHLSLAMDRAVWQVVAEALDEMRARLPG